jgi:hypothetical protein
LCAPVSLLLLRPDGLDHLIFELPGKVKITAQLQVHPEIQRITKEPGQAQSAAGGDSSSSIDQVIDALVWQDIQECAIMQKAG